MAGMAAMVQKAGLLHVPKGISVTVITEAFMELGGKAAAVLAVAEALAEVVQARQLVGVVVLEEVGGALAHLER